MGGTDWKASGEAGTSGIGYFTGVESGYVLSLDSGGNLSLVGHDSAGASYTIASAATSVSPATTYTLALEVSGEGAAVSLTASLDAATLFGGVQSDTTSDRSLSSGLAGLFANNADRSGDSGDQPRIKNFKIEHDPNGDGLETLLDDDFARADSSLIPAHTPPAGAVTDAADPVASHFWEWGDHKHLAISGTDVGPFVSTKGIQFGDASVSSGTNYKWADLYQIAPSSTDHRAEASFILDFGTATSAGPQEFGVIVRGSKSAADGATPSLANFTGYLFRLVLGGTSSGMYLERYDAGTATVLASSTPLQAGFISGKDQTPIHLAVSGTGGTVTLAGRIANLAEVSATDTSASRITATNQAGIYVGWSPMGAGGSVANSAFTVRAKASEVGHTTLTGGNEPNNSASVTHAPDFVEETTVVYQTNQIQTERGNIKSRALFGSPRRIWRARWENITTAQATTTIAELKTMMPGRGATAALELSTMDGSKMFVVTDQEFSYSNTSGGLVNIAPVQLVESLG
jgi:hypothetical protein